MLRAAIYARYSSDVQNERSIDDQIVVCRRSAEARGWNVSQAFSDAAISGAAMANRPGLQAALASAERGEIDVLLCEAEDRIARNLEHLAHVVNRLDFAGARLATLSTEHVETMHVAFQGAMAQEFLKNLSAKTKRGMHSNAEKGLATGSRTYGYRSQPGGTLEIIPEEAEVVRKIFAAYAAGATPRAIAAYLNAHGVRTPRGGTWAASSINGSRQRGNGVLNTELYVGVKVWNRIEMRKDPRTGQRISTPRPPSEWKRTLVPELRIVDDAPWQAVRARKDAEGYVPYRQLRRRRSGVFSGLIKCGGCGATMTSYDGRRRLICAAHREKGDSVCANSRTVSRAEVESRVVHAIRTRILSPAAVRAYVKLYHSAWHRRAAASANLVAPLRKRQGELERTIKRLVDRICDGTDTPATNGRLKELEAEKTTLDAQLRQAEVEAPPPVTMHPGLADHYARRIEELQQLLASKTSLDGEIAEKLIATARDLVVKIVLTPTGKGAEHPVDIQLHGTLATFLEPPAGARAPGLYEVVAGGGYHHRQTDEALVVAA